MKKSIQFLAVAGAIATASAQTPEPASDKDMAEVVSPERRFVEPHQSERSW